MKNARHEYYTSEFSYVYYPQTEEELNQILQKFSAEYNTIFYASFDNSLVLDLVANSATST